MATSTRNPGILWAADQSSVLSGADQAAARKNCGLAFMGGDSQGGGTASNAYNPSTNKIATGEDLSALGGLFVKVSTNSTFADVKAIFSAGKIPYLVTNSSGYGSIFYPSLDGGSGQYGNYYYFSYVSSDRVNTWKLASDDSWTYNHIDLQPALVAGEFIDIDSSDNTITMKKTGNAGYGIVYDTTTRVVAFPGAPAHLHKSYIWMMDVPLPSHGLYRFSFNVIIRIGNLPSASFNMREMFIMACTGNQTESRPTYGLKGARFVFPDNVTTGSKFSVPGTLFVTAGPDDHSNITLNISNEQATDAESLFIDYTAVYWEKITTQMT